MFFIQKASSENNYKNIKKINIYTQQQQKTHTLK